MGTAGMEMQLEDFESNPPHQGTQVHDLINSRLAHIADVSIHSSPSSIKDALDVLDDEIDVLRDVLASVAARRNAISQISRLPPEILSRIFHFTGDFHRAMDSKAHPNVGQSKAWAGWLEVLGVCRRWRAIALYDLSLWTELTYTTSLPRLGQILARVQGAPVKLHRYIKSNMKCEFEVINDHLSHIKELMIVLDDKTAYFELCHALTRTSLSNSAPLLESLTFATRRPGESSDEDEELVTPLPETFFAGEMPALRRLALQSYLPQPLLSSPLITESITHFELTFPPTPLGETQGTENNPPVRFYLEEPRRAHLLSCLGRMPNLEVLQLVRCFPPHFASDSWPRDVTVHLLHLQRIMLNGSDTDCAGILERVTMPPSVSLSMTCLFRDHMPSEDLAALQPIVSAIQAYTTSAASAHRITALAFQVSERYPMLRMHAWREQASGLEEDMPFLSVDFGAGDAVCLELLELLCGGPRLSDLRVLGLFSAERTDAPMGWTGEYLAQLLADCDLTSVAHLVINSQTAVLVPAATDAPGDFFGQLAAMSVLRGAMGFVSRHANEQVYVDQLIDSLVELKRRKGNLQTVYVQRRDVARWRTQVQSALSVRPLPANTRKYFRPFEIG